MYLVTTRVKIKPGTVYQVLELFRTTNPGLVKNQKDWVKASFSYDEEKSVVIVNATWKNKESYLKFSKSEPFTETMKSFGQFFLGPPEVQISNILFEM